MEDMIQGYQAALAKVQKAIQDTENLPTLDEINQDQLRILQERILQEMERDLLDTLKQLRHEIPSQPSPVSKRSKEQREVPVDPATLDQAAYISAFQPEESTSSLSLEDRRRLYRVLQTLTPREQEVYWLSRGKGFCSREIADMLSLSKSMVKKVLRQAEKKIEKKLQALKTVELCDLSRIRSQNEVEKSS